MLFNSLFIVNGAETESLVFPALCVFSDVIKIKYSYFLNITILNQEYFYLFFSTIKKRSATSVTDL